MKRVTYAGTSFVTGTDIADSLLALVAALGVNSETAAVHVPAIDDNDQITSVDLVIGPSSEVVAMTIQSSASELVDVDVVNGFDERARSLAIPHAVASSEEMAPIWEYPDID